MWRCGRASQGLFLLFHHWCPPSCFTFFFNNYWIEPKSRYLLRWLTHSQSPSIYPPITIYSHLLATVHPTWQPHEWNVAAIHVAICWTLLGMCDVINCSFEFWDYYFRGIMNLIKMHRRWRLRDARLPAPGAIYRKTSMHTRIYSHEHDTSIRETPLSFPLFNALFSDVYIYCPPAPSLSVSLPGISLNSAYHRPRPPANITPPPI